MKVGNTTFEKDCHANTSFEDFEEIYKNVTFKDGERNTISKREMFKLMGGTFKKKKGDE